MTAEGSRPWRRAASPATAIVVFGLALAELATGIACALAAGISFGAAVGRFTVTDGGIGLTLSACGALLAWHRPRNPVGWLFLAGGVAYATSTMAVELAEFGATAAGAAGCSARWPRCLSWPGRWRSGCACPWPCCCSRPAAHPALAGDGWPGLSRRPVSLELMFSGPGRETVDRRTVSAYLVLPSYDRLGAVWAATNIAYAAVFRPYPGLARGPVPSRR